jgi:uncharacterized protein (DUF2141 family)
MKGLLVIPVVYLLLSLNAFSQVSLEVTIKGLRNEKGNMMFQLMDEKEATVHQEIGKPLKAGSGFVVPNLKPGRYAVRYFHDENTNGKLDTNFLGMPVEGYGFSNNAAAKLGPPPFKEWLFDLTENKKIELNITY